MTFKVYTYVWGSPLKPELKMTLLALASFADGNGESIYPSLGTIARMPGRKKRQTRRNIAELCAKGILIPETPRTGGRQTTRYRLNLDALDEPDPGHVRPPTPVMDYRGESAETPVMYDRDPGHGRPGTPVTGDRRSSSRSISRSVQ
jgi:hypothetical protein